MGKTERTLIEKGKKYSRMEGDRLSQFHKAAQLLKTIPEQTLLGFVTKHIITIFDWVSELEDPSLPDRTKEEWEEKIGDVIAYMILLGALLEDRRRLKEGHDEPENG
jgi:hypothetical protein